ncbi:IPExxxVDY family protein [Luteibaculum oceani]|uniref:IPExxxVDY family protein n=1 Tax=Luteibaculum oceani TaxID=1294296 RepID=A0A5C6VPW2_9FLAO|nr:IPExxxVDY family protein [Luteibaculum oceani]TXC85408.1 IPExxxVDY family protein [Luteibaculum oceani]
MTVHYLDFDDEPEFHMIGIACHLKNYRLCWLVNKALNINLERSQDPYVFWPGKSIKSEHALFTGFNEFWKSQHYLIQNKGFQQTLVVPEHRAADYLLITKNPKEEYSTFILQELNKQNLILTAFKINPVGLKSSANLTFE